VEALEAAVPAEVGKKSYLLNTKSKQNTTLFYQNKGIKKTQQKLGFFLNQKLKRN
jgi:hypothetical protein